MEKCPNCESNYISMNASADVFGDGFSPFTCRDCGYQFGFDVYDEPIVEQSPQDRSPFEVDTPGWRHLTRQEPSARLDFFSIMEICKLAHEEKEDD